MAIIKGNTQWVKENKDALRVNFDRKLNIEFHGVKVTSDAGLLTFRELDEAFGFTAMINSKLTDNRVCRLNGKSQFK